MLDLKFLRENIDLVKKAIQLKNESADIDGLIKLDKKRREIIGKVEQLKNERNENSKQVADLKRKNQDASDLITRTKQLSQKIKDLDTDLLKTVSELEHQLARVPNIPHSSAPEGQSAEDNVEVEHWGDIPEFDFEIKNHVVLGDYLDILDFKRGGKISGSGFPVYKGLGARLERALLNFMIDITKTS